MTISTFLQTIIQAFFIVLNVVAVFDYLRHRDAARRDIALMISSLGIPIGLPLIPTALEVSAPWLGTIGNLVLVMQPYLILRLVRYFRPVSARLLRAAQIATVICWITLLVVWPKALQTAAGVVLVVYLIAINGYAMLALANLTRSAAGIMRQRLRLIAAGSGLLALVLILLIVAGLLSLRIPILTAALELMIFACFLFYYLGFSPPRSLRLIWQSNELRSYLSRLKPTEMGKDMGVAESLGRLSQTAMEASGAMAAGVVRLEDESGKWEVRAATDSTVLASALERGQRMLEQVWHVPRPFAQTIAEIADKHERAQLQAINAKTWLIVPIIVNARPWGLLVVLWRERSLFVDDDLSLLGVLSSQTGLVLENNRLFEELRKYSEGLEQKVVQQTTELQQSEHRYQLTLDYLMEGCQIINPDWRYLYVNDTAARHGLRTRADLLGHTMMEAYPGIEATPMFDALARSMIDRVAQRIENHFEYPDGTSAWFELSIQPVPDGLFILSLDISERKRSEAAIQDMNTELEHRVVERTAQLEAANKELEAFSYSVSHDLRAPLRSIDGFSRILIEDYAQELSEDAKRYLDMVRADTQQMGRLIDDLLTFSRLSRQDLKKQTINPTEIVNFVLTDMRLEQEGRPVEIHVDELPCCQADPALLKQVYVNLLSNAFKYTRKCDHALIQVGSSQENGEIVYYVKDNGVGFNMRYAHKLFKVFQRLHSADDYEGTGVGLAIIQRVINRHGGRVWAEAEPNKGASFYFTLSGGQADG